MAATSLPELFMSRADASPRTVAVRTAAAGVWQEAGWADVVATVARAADTMRAAGVSTGSVVVLVMRLLPAIRSFIALPAGVVRMSFWRFLLFSCIGSTIWCAVLALIGHQLGQHWETISSDIRRFDVPIAILVILLIAYAVWLRVRTMRSHAAESPADRTGTEG